MPRFVSLAISLLLLCVSAGVLEGQHSMHETVDVPLVNLEIIVTDSQGEQVRGLSAADFRVLEDGESVTVEFFDFIDASSETVPDRPHQKAISTEPPPSTPPVHLVIFFDDLSPGSSDRYRALIAVRELLQGGLPRGARVMLVAFDGSTEVLLPFTEDLDEIERAFTASARRITPRSLQGERERQRTMELIREDFHTGPCLFGLDYARTYAQGQNHEVLQTINAMAELVDSLSGLEGRKALLYLGEGVPMRPGEEAFLFYLEGCSGQGAAQGMEDATDVALMGNVKHDRPDPHMETLSMSQFDTSHRWHRLAARANGLGVSLYSAISTPPGAHNFISIENPVRGASDSILSSIGFNQADSLSMLASDTGARLFSGANLADELPKLASDLSSYYLLSYTPSDPDDLRIRSIEVEIEGRQLEVHHRTSVSLKSSAESISDRLLSQLMYGIGENRQQVRVRTIEDEGSKPSIVLYIPLRNLTLFPDSGGHRGLFTAFVVASNDRGRRTPVRTATVPVTIPPETPEAPRAEEFVYEIEMELEPGDHRVAIALKDELSGETSFLGLEIERRPTVSKNETR